MATSMFDKLRQMNSTTPTAQLMQKTAEQQRKEKAAATGTPYKTSTTTAPTLQSSDPVYTGKVSSSYVPGSLGNQKVGTSSGGGGTTPPLTPDPPIPPTGGGSGDSGATQAYLDALAALRAQQAADEEAQRIRTQATIKSINGNVPTINQDYENQQAQNYITHTKNMYGLSDFLRSQGMSGGMSESKAGELTTNYETSRNGADQAKNSALDNIRQLIAQAQATGDEGLATIASNATKAYQDLLAQQASAEQQQSQFDANQAQENQQYQDSLTQQTFENNLATNEYNLAVANANKKATTSGSSSDSGYTASQINSMYSSGLIDEETAKSMLGLSTSSTDTTQTANYYNEAERLLQQRTTPSSQVALIKQWNMEGKLSDAQAQTLLQRYGLSM